MKADALSLTSLYNTVNKAYVVPDYQRPFAWDTERATDLLSGILADAADDQEMTSIGTFLFCSVPTQPKHPFGDNSTNTNAPAFVWEIVDGQQRLTVLALLGYALQRRFRELSGAGLTYSPSLEFDLMFSNFRRFGTPRVPLLIRDGDSFDAELKSDLGQTLAAFSIAGRPIPHGTIGKALDGIQGWVNEHLTSENFGAFCDHLLDKCKYVQVIADSQDVAFMMFEPLNSTSEPLTAFEVFRSKAIRELGSLADFKRTLQYLAYDRLRRDDVIRRSNQLVFTVAQTYSGERPRVQFVRLKKYLDGKVDTDFVGKLEQGAEFLSSVWNTQSLDAPWLDSTTKDCIRFLKASNHILAIPLLMRYFQETPAELTEVIKSISAFFALWRSVFPTNKLPEVYRALLGEGSPNNMAVAGGRLKSVAELRAYFRVEFERKLAAPPGTVVSEAWLERAAPLLDYESQSVLCRFLIFTEMGATLKHNLAPDDPWTECDDIEHVMPASTNPPPAALHRLGNLTFLPPEVNRSLADIDWARKRQAYKWLAQSTKPRPCPDKFSDGSEIPPGVIRYLSDPNSSALVYLSEMASKSAWDQRAIERRTRNMLSTAWSCLHDDWLA